MIAEQYSSVSIGFKVHSDVKLGCPMVQVLHSCRRACHRHALQMQQPVIIVGAWETTSTRRNEAQLYIEASGSTESVQ